MRADCRDTGPPGSLTSRLLWGTCHRPRPGGGCMCLEGQGGGFGLDASIHMPPDLTFCPVSPRGCAHSSQQPGSGPRRKLGWCHVGVHGALLLGQVRPCSPRIHTAGCRHLGAELLGPARRQCGGLVSARRGDLQGRRGRDGEGERRCLLTDAASLLPPPPQFLLI